MSETDFQEAGASPEAAEPDGTPLSNGSDDKRERSTIKFPYGSLKDAEDVARHVSDYGAALSVGTLAGLMNSTTTSGAFRTKLATATTFGVIVNARGTVEITELGSRLRDPAQAADARVDAFLGVELYAAMYEKFDGKMLPGDSGIENAMVELGVSKKIADRARQAFQKSAEMAGFFSGGRTRLLKPARSSATDLGDNGGEKPDPKDDETKKPKLSEDALLKGLWSKLPDDGPFPARERAQWLKTLPLILNMVYGEVEDDDETPKPPSRLNVTHADADRGQQGG